MHVVHVPSPRDEASRQLMRDRGELQKEVLQHRDRMRKLLATLGCWDEVDHKAFAGRLARNEGGRTRVTAPSYPTTGGTTAEADLTLEAVFSSPAHPAATLLVRGMTKIRS